MFSRTIIALFICILAVKIHATEKCPGVSSDSYEDLKGKYDLAPIVAYGSVASVQNDIAKFTVKCVLKGSLSDSSVELTQRGEVLNLTECHYLKANKEYVVFLETLKTTGSESKTVYKLADLEEIEVTGDSARLFLEFECDDEEDHGIEMTIFYYKNNLKCNQMTATCNQATKGSILAMNLPPLTKDTTFLGGYKKTLGVPKMSEDGNADISGKQLGGTGDEQIRGSATMMTISMPWMVLLAALMMKNYF